MIHYGFEPPWSGRSANYGWWKQGEELWDGSGFAWTLQPPESNWFQILRTLPFTSLLAPKIEWLEDEFMPQMVSS